ncbi:hypothetical protein BH11PSE1_BH11PSE1_10570 [soil metagenome]
MSDTPTLAEIYATRPRPSAEVLAFPAERVVYAHAPRLALAIFHGGRTLTYVSRDALVDDVLRAADAVDFRRMPEAERLRLMRQILASIDGAA